MKQGYYISPRGARLGLHLYIIGLETCIAHHAITQSGAIVRPLESSGGLIGLPADIAQVGQLHGQTLS